MGYRDAERLVFPARAGLSLEEIEAGRTPNGGWTKATLASWGVPWPPPRGWKRRLSVEWADGEPSFVTRKQLLNNRKGLDD